MKLEYVANTGFYLENKKKVFGMDLWYTQGAFEGSWFHYPPLRETKYSIEECDYIYISHIHPDHCDFNKLRSAKKDAKIIVPNYFSKLLERKCRAFGYENVVSLAPNEICELEPGLKVKLYGQFENNLFHEAAFGNLIDSALVIEWDGKKILNCNDNYLTTEWAETLNKEFGNFDLAMIPHSASGPYPASFRNLSEKERVEEAKSLQDRYINSFAEVTAALAPKLVIPCAAEYVIVGKEYWKNPYIGLADPQIAADRVNNDSNISQKTKAFRMDCGSVLNLEAATLEGLPLRSLDIEELMRFAEANKNIPYHYEWEDSFNDIDMDALATKAREHLWQKQERLNWKRDYQIFMYVDEAPYCAFNFKDPEISFDTSLFNSKKAPYMNCYLTKALFYQILKSKAHWNNAEGGLHIDFYREPNEYVPEVFTLLSFFHEER